MAVVFPIERNSQRAVVTVAIIFSVLAITACGLRVAARRVAHRTLDSSDWCIFAACLVTVVYQSINVTSVFIGGVGFHFQEIKEAHGLQPITQFLKFLIAIQLLWALSLSLCKISILIMYTKIFSMRAFVWTALLTAVVIVLWALATTLMGFLMCRPFEYNWNPALSGGRCGNQVLSYQATGALNLVLYKKIVLMVSFAVGIFTCVVSVLRLVALSSIDYSDITYNVPESLIFSGLEPCLAVTLACVPVLQPLAMIGRSSTGRRTSVMSSGKTNNRKAGNFKQLDDNSSQHQLQPIDSSPQALEAREEHSRGSGSGSRLSSNADERVRH